jgi:hypothetical protein
MSVSVALDELRQHIDRLGPTAFAVTSGPDGHPHVVSVAVAWDDDRLVFDAGNTTRGNVEGNPPTTLLWSAPVGEAYSLIIDGDGRVTGDRVALVPARAVLHRLVDAAGDGPSCVKILPGA